MSNSMNVRGMAGELAVQLIATACGMVIGACLAALKNADWSDPRRWPSWALLLLFIIVFSLGAATWQIIVNWSRKRGRTRDQEQSSLHATEFLILAVHPQGRVTVEMPVIVLLSPSSGHCPARPDHSQGAGNGACPRNPSPRMDDSGPPTQTSSVIWSAKSSRPSRKPWANCERLASAWRKRNLPAAYVPALFRIGLQLWCAKGSRDPRFGPLRRER